MKNYGSLLILHFVFRVYVYLCFPFFCRRFFSAISFLFFFLNRRRPNEIGRPPPFPFPHGENATFSRGTVTRANYSLLVSSRVAARVHSTHTPHPCTLFYASSFTYTSPNVACSGSRLIHVHVYQRKRNPAVPPSSPFIRVAAQSIRLSPLPRGVHLSIR